MIALTDVAKAYGERSILKSISLTVAEGEFVSIVGSSASGKTTLLKIACGLAQADSGTATLNGAALAEFSRDAAIVFQNYSLLPWMTALENVRLAVESAFPERDLAWHTEQSAKYLKMVGLGQAFGKKPSALSGGMKQRVAIARAFAVEPKVLFLDEPFGALDALTRATLQQELVQMCSAQEKPVTALMITNSVDEAILLSDRIHALGRGPGAALSEGIAVTSPRPRGTHAAESIEIRALLADFLAGRKLKRVEEVENATAA